MPPVTRSQPHSLVPRAHERGTVAVIVDNINWPCHEFLKVQPEADNLPQSPNGFGVRRE